MPGVGQPVCLTRSAPFHVDTHQLVFYDVIDASITCRSSVLSTIADAGGDARLPDSITLSDFKQWVSAVAERDESVRSKPFSFLCTVAKVRLPRIACHCTAWSQSTAMDLIGALSTGQLINEPWLTSWANAASLKLAKHSELCQALKRRRAAGGRRSGRQAHR